MTEAEREYFKAKRVKPDKPMTDREIDIAFFPQTNLTFDSKPMENESVLCLNGKGLVNAKLCGSDACREYRLGKCNREANF